MTILCPIEVNEIKRFIYTLEKIFHIKIYTCIYETESNGRVQCPFVAKKPTKKKKEFSIKGMNKYGWTKATYYNHNVIVFS